jgi:hypothetical protein
MSASHFADQEKIGRVVGLSLAGLWLAVSMMAAIADAADTGAGSAVAAVENKETSAKVVAASN